MNNGVGGTNSNAVIVAKKGSQRHTFQKPVSFIIRRTGVAPQSMTFEIPTYKV
jgi:hypothetical protein